MFNINFPNLDSFLNPRQSSSEEYANIGSVYYMFNLKLESDRYRYCILPPTAWRILDYIYAEYQKENNCSFDNVIGDKNIIEFYNFLKNDENKPSESKNDFKFDKQLMVLYKKIGGLSGIVKLYKHIGIGNRLTEYLFKTSNNAE